MRIKNFKISNFDDDALRKVLWMLCYTPEYELKWLKEDEITSKELINHIFAECKNASRQLFFGGEKAIADTKNVDLGIENGIVRDVVIKRCYSAVFDEKHCIEKAIILLKTSDDGFEYNSRRIVGGLLEIGFTSKEAEYIKRTCNCHPIALLLEKYNEELQEKLNSVDEDVFNSYSTTGEASSTPVSKMELKDAVETPSVAIENIIKNKDIISKLISCKFGGFSNIDEIRNEIIETAEILDGLRALECSIEKLNKDGISLDYIINKQNEIKSFLDSMTVLM